MDFGIHRGERHRLGEVEEIRRLGGLETNLCCLGLAKLGPGVGAGGGIILINA